MSDINGALQPTHESFFFTIDSPNSPSLLLTPESFSLERGPKYRAYAELRESRLRKKQRLYEDNDDEDDYKDPLPLPPPIASPLITPPRKKVTFQGNNNSNGGSRRLSQSGRKGMMSTMVAKSVPDFSSVLRKENRKPISTFEMTPPSLKNCSSSSSKMSRLGGSKSTGGMGGSKSAVGAMGRKSYGNIEELKGLSAGVNSAINGEVKGGRRGVNVPRIILGYRQY